MLPSELSAEQFAAWSPGARNLAVQHLTLLQQLPLSFLPSLLRELIEYENAFPAERIAMDRQLATLAALSKPQLSDWVSGFAGIRLTAAQKQADWVNQPAHFTEDLSAYLWASHQMDAFRAAATAFASRLDVAIPPAVLPAPRLGIAIIGQGVASYTEPLFANLRAHGTYFTNVKPANGLNDLLGAITSRAHAHPEKYAHWYVDGGSVAPHDPLLTTVSYAALETARATLLKNIEMEVGKPGMGPEQLRSYMMRLSPADLHMGGDALLDRFQIKLLTEGSGTQIFSTTFAQWTAREVLRRAQPLSLLVRYAPRQRQRPMNELLSSSLGDQQVDAVGSLVDGDMGAYYQWIDQQRLSQSERSSFVVWFEGHAQALAIGPSLPRGVESKSPVDLHALVALAVG